MRDAGVMVGGDGIRADSSAQGFDIRGVEAAIGNGDIGDIARRVVCVQRHTDFALQ